jgi:prevent-host-death family protein
VAAAEPVCGLGLSRGATKSGNLLLYRTAIFEPSCGFAAPSSKVPPDLGAASERVMNMTYNKVMIRANINEIKAHFSSYVKKARAGEVVVVCERNVPVAELRPIKVEEEPKKRELGFMKGTIWIADDAFDPMSDEELALWEDGPIFPEHPAVDGTAP